MAQVAESCQDVSLEVDSHDNQGRSDMAIAYCTVMSHYDLISHISSAPVCWICTENTGIDLWNDSLVQSGKFSKAKTVNTDRAGVARGSTSL